MRTHDRRRFENVALIVITLAWGCAARGGHVPVANEQGELMSPRDQARLAAVAAARAGKSDADGYRIGPDDLLEIRIPDLLGDAGTVPSGAAQAAPIAEAPVFRQGLRVGAAGDVALPFVGAVHA